MTSFEKLREVVKEIRNKCPWDQKQTFVTLKKHLIEESYEYLEAVDNENPSEMAEELGDVLLQIMLNSEIASETDLFDVDTVIRTVTKKMIDRHPHVFGELSETELSVDEVKQNWEVLKSQTKAPKTSILDGVPKALPAAMKAQQIQQKCAHVGFDWDSVDGAFAKVKEEVIELGEEITSGNNASREEEFGDLLFAMVNLGRKLGLDVESSLNKASDKFTRRFHYVESRYATTEELKNATLEEMDSYWDEIKKKEKAK